MTLKDLYRLSEAALADKLTFITSVISANPTAYTLSAPIAAAMADSADLYVTALTDQESAQAAFSSAVLTKTEMRDAALSTIAAYLNVIYSSPAVDDTSITALGLAPRSTSRTPITPQQPLGLIAVPSPTGQCELSWSRNGNPYSVQFVVETRVEAGDWTVAGITSKAKVNLTGFVPGETTYFRVYAQKNDENSVPSNIAVIYEGGELTALSVAA